MDLALLADDAIQALELGGEVLVHLRDVVERVGDLPGHSRPVHGQPDGEVSPPQCLQRGEEGAGIDLVGGGGRKCSHVFTLLDGTTPRAAPSMRLERNRKPGARAVPGGGRHEPVKGLGFLRRWG